MNTRSDLSRTSWRLQGKQLTAVPEPASQRFYFHLPLLREEREGKDRWQKEILPTAELNTRLTSARFFYQSPGPCLTPCSVNRSLVDLIRTDLVEWIDPLLYALLLSQFIPTRTRRTSFDYSWDIVERFFYGGEWGVKRPMQQRRTAWIGIRLLRQTTEKERLRVRTLVDLSLAC